MRQNRGFDCSEIFETTKHVFAYSRPIFPLFFRYQIDYIKSVYICVFGCHSNDPFSFNLNKLSEKVRQNEKLFWMACGNVTQSLLLKAMCLRVKVLKGCLVVMEIKPFSISRILLPTLTVWLHHVVLPRNDRRHFFKG